MEKIVARLSRLCFCAIFCFLLSSQGFAADPKPLQPIKVPPGKAPKPPAPNPAAGREKELQKDDHALYGLGAGEEDDATRDARLRAEAEKEVRSQIEHIRARAADMENTYGFTAFAFTLKKSLAAQGITNPRTLEHITNWDRVPFNETWQNAWKHMYDPAVAELTKSLGIIRDDPLTVRKNLAELDERVKKWDETEKEILELFREALERTAEVARLDDKYGRAQSDYSNKLLKKWSDAMDKKMKADLKAIENEMADIRSSRRSIFSEIIKKAKARASFVFDAVGLRPPAGLKRVPAKDWQKDELSPEKKKALNEARKKASAAESAAGKAAYAAEEAKKDVEFMEKRYAGRKEQAEKASDEYVEAHNKGEPDAEQLYEGYKVADSFAEKAYEELEADKKKHASLEKKAAYLRAEADKAMAEYNALKAASEKGE